MALLQAPSIVPPATMAAHGDSDLPVPLTLVYKLVGDLPIYLDLYAPPLLAVGGSGTAHRLPAVVYFHGGGLAVGNRRSWFPKCLHSKFIVNVTSTVLNLRSGSEGRMTSSGIVFVSADYRLIPPAIGQEILEDIQDLFTFLSHDVNSSIRERLLVDRTGDARHTHGVFEIDPNAIAVAGTSSGGLCAYLAATHAVPRPVAVLSMYGMGGDMLVSACAPSYC